MCSVVFLFRKAPRCEVPKVSALGLSLHLFGLLHVLCLLDLLLLLEVPLEVPLPEATPLRAPGVLSAFGSTRC